MGRSSIIRAAILTIVGIASLNAIYATQSADELIERAQKLDRSLQAQAALQLYQQAEALEPKRVEILVGIARQYRHLMADATKPEDKLNLLAQSLAYSQQAVQSDPKSAEAHLAVAITYGKRVALESSKDKVTTSRLLRTELDLILKLDPKSDTAWHLLGRWSEGYAELSGVRRALGEAMYGKLPAPSHEDAARCFQKAIAIDPNRLMHYIELGRVYGQMGRTEEARALLKKGLSMPNREKDDPDYKKRGTEALAALP